MKRLGLAICLVVLPSLASSEPEDPISAVDWLSHSLDRPGAPSSDSPVTTGIATESIVVQSLDAPSPDGVGILPRSVTGLPPDLWGDSDVETLARQIAAFPVSPLPAVQDQFRRLMLAELVPPVGSGPDAPLLRARIDALLARGALEEAEALLERAASTDPELFRRSFDVGLLTGREQAACARMRAIPGISPSFPARIFCLARTGDWTAAALTLESAKALGELSAEEDALLAQFLDPELAEMLPPVSVPERPSPLTFRMLEAIGSPIPTPSLPLAFAHSDLRPTSGWKAQLEAAERLARTGAIPPGTLFAIYGERRPAASGGVWDRVSGIQALSRSINARDIPEIEKTLPEIWRLMGSGGLAVPFAQAFGPVLGGLDPSGSSTGLVARIQFLSNAYESVSESIGRDDPLALAAGIARGEAVGTPNGLWEDALAAAFSEPPDDLPRNLVDLVDDNRLGEALLDALETLATGRDNDPREITMSLRFLRSIGLEDIARRAALQILLLEAAA